MTDAPRSTGYVLRAAADADLDTLMGWCDSAAIARYWGGPALRYPFTRDSLRADTRWDELSGFVLLDPAGSPCGFGQLYDHVRRVHLARLLVSPGSRGRGVGKTLVLELLAAGALRWPYAEASLYVYRDNAAAVACYRAAGFRDADFPPERAAFAADCRFLTRPLGVRDGSVPDSRG